MLIPSFLHEGNISNPENDILMSMVPYNDYVLSASVQAGWITQEQEAFVREMLASLPGAAALDLLVEQEMLNEENAKVLLDLIHQSQAAEEPVVTEEAVGTRDSSKSSAAEVTSSAAGNFQTVQDYLRYAIEHGASDLHISPDTPPKMRMGGRIVVAYEGAPKLTREETEKLARDFLDPEQIQHVEEHGSFEFCYEIPGLSRFRTSVVRQRRGWETIFRIISGHIKTMKDLGLPQVLYDLTRYHNGLILVTGAVGCGKSTTLASMVDHINKERRDHIITLEDPIEYVFKPDGCQVSQREVHTNTKSFSAALRAALREDPDVIMVGEMRDLETISLAITASETGHLVLGTLHTSTAARTLDRLLDVFPIEQREQIRTMVSESIRGIVCQQLIPRADGKGRVLALEIMTNSPAVANLIREGKTFMLPGVMQTSRKQGMVQMDESIKDLYDKQTITIEEAFSRTENKSIFS